MPPPNPTEGELAILRVLWSRKTPMTVRDVHAELSKGKDTAYTTVLKMLTIMAGAHPRIRAPRKGAIAHFLTARWLADHLD